MKKELDYLDHILQCLQWIESHIHENKYRGVIHSLNNKVKR